MPSNTRKLLVDIIEAARSIQRHLGGKTRDDYLADEVLRGFDELLDTSAPDFPDSGLRVPSVIRPGFLTTLPPRQIGGGLGRVSSARLQRLRQNLSQPLMNPPTA